MGYVFQTIKKLFFWGYARNTWQYDVLCALILAFIFLTPQSWFDTSAGMRNWSHGEPTLGAEHQKSVASIILPADNLPAQMTQNEIENRVRTITGRREVEILGVRRKVDESGRTVAYEVDIR